MLILQQSLKKCFIVLSHQNHDKCGKSCTRFAFQGHIFLGEIIHFVKYVLIAVCSIFCNLKNSWLILLCLRQVLDALQVRRVFLLAIPNKNQKDYSYVNNKQVQDEAAEYMDIVQVPNNGIFKLKKKTRIIYLNSKCL